MLNLLNGVVSKKKKNLSIPDVNGSLTDEQIEDIEYVRNNILKGCKIPPNYSIKQNNNE
jgi:hypothetical protein